MVSILCSYGDFLTYEEQVAKILTNYSLTIRPGHEVAIFGDVAAKPLLQEIYAEVLRLGAHPTLVPMFGEFKEIYFKYASDEQLSHESYASKAIYGTTDHIINVWTETNTKRLSAVDPQKIAMNQKANTAIIKTLMEREAQGELSWTLTVYPSHSLAQEASMSLLDYKEFVYKACHLDSENPIADWKAISEHQARICEWLNTKKELRFIGEDTDLSMSIDGRTWVNCDGKKNFPDGEVFTGPVEDTVNGTIRFTYPLIYLGNEIEDIRLTFKDGVVIDASASKGEALLKQVLEIDEGAKRVGEIAIGTNYGITRFTKHMLFDEKIGGTMHLALGRSIPESGGTNMSAIHLDILKDMTKGGKVYADDELFYEDGSFLIGE